MASPGSASEDGEIIDNGVDDSNKAVSHRLDGNGVDRPDRHRGRHSRSPEYESGGRYQRRSPSPRGYKRSRDDRDTYRGGRGGDTRRFRIHYEDVPERRGRPHHDQMDQPQSRGRYEDLDRPPSGSDNHRPDRRSPPRSSRYDDWDGYPNKRRDRAGRGDRGRRDRNGFGRNENGDQAKSMKYAQNERQSRDDSTSKRATVADATSTKVVAKSDQGVTVDRTKANMVEESRESHEPAKPLEPEPDWEAQEPVNVDAEIERRRKRREEILQKSRASTPLLQAIQVPLPAMSPKSTHHSTPRRTEVNTPRSDGDSPSLSASVPQEAMSPAAFDLANDQDLINLHGKTRENDEDGPSAADYDPTIDMQEDERRDGMRQGNVGLHAEDRHPAQADIALEEPGKKPSKTDEDDFDMFAEDFDDEKFARSKPAAPKSTPVVHEDQLPPHTQQNGGGILEGDDKDGYYKIRPGEILNGRYQIQSTLGKGMFSGVARALDITNKRLIAIKIMRNNDALRKGGFTEIAILQKLNAADPDNKKHIVKFERSFEYKGHLCMAFENLSLNLREVLKKFGNNIGINLNATRAYAYQIFLALGHMRKCSIIHADLKPDNILVNENRNILKICDLGTAIDRSDAATAHNEIAPYLVSRFYRAPEIILGMPYDYAIDMWSIGCTLYELYTGKILFTGDSNNQMLKTMMEIRGKFSGKLYRRGQLAQMHFDELGSFISVERDKTLGKTSVRTLPVVKPTRDLRTRLMAASSGMTDSETRELNHFIDLLERCLALNPDKRITPSEALKHPFFNHRVR